MNDTRLFSCPRLFTSLCTVLWSAGFFLSLPLAQPYEIARLLSIACVLTAAALAAGARLASQDGLHWPRSRVLLAGGAFWVLVFGSVAWSSIVLTSFIAACTFSLLPAGAVLFLCVSDRRLFSQICIYAVGFMLGALAAWALVQYTFFPQMLVGEQVRWPFANPGSYAALLALGFFPALGVALSAERKWQARLALILCAVTLDAMIIISSRGVIVASIGGFFLFILCARGAWRGRGHVAAILAVAALPVLVLPSLFLHSHRIIPLTRVLTMTTQTSSLAVRGAIWRGMAAMIAQHPLAGTGIGTFFLYYPQFRLPADNESGGFMAHDDPLQFWAELGVAGPLLFYVFCALAAWRMLRALKFLSPASAERTMIVATFCGLAMIVAHTHIDFDFYVAPILCLFGLTLGVWHQATGKALHEATRRFTVPSHLPAMGWSLTVLPLIGVIFVLQGFLLSEYQVNRAAVYAEQNNNAAFASAVNRAGRMAFGWNARAYLTAAAVPVDIIEYPLQILPAPDQQKFQAQAKILLDQAARYNPRLVEVPYYRASLAGDRHDRTTQEIYLRQALTLDPAHLPSRTMLAEIYNRAGDQRQALQILKDGLVWTSVTRGIAPGAAAYYRLLTGLAADAGEKTTSTQAQAMLNRITATQ